MELISSTQTALSPTSLITEDTAQLLKGPLQPKHLKLLGIKAFEILLYNVDCACHQPLWSLMNFCII